MTLAMALPPWLHPAWQSLQQARTQQRLPHALLFDGPSGWGKRFLVRQFARDLLELPLASENALGVDAEGADRDLLTHPDFHLVQRLPGSSGQTRAQILIDQVRELNEFLVRTATSGRARVAILEPAESLNVNAANALLKRLEEPGDGCHLLLVTERAPLVMPTIRSRCQRLLISPGTRSQALAWLRERVTGDLNPERWLDLVGGAPLRALAQQGSQLPELASQVDRFLAGGEAQPLLTSDRQRADETLTLLYRGLALQVRQAAGREARVALQLLDRVLLARRQLLSLNNPNVNLLLEDLLLGWSGQRGR